MGRRRSGEDRLWVDGYVRVSRVGLRRGERFISPQAQREAIESWAARRPARLLEVVTELDEPGGRFDRPELERAVKRIEAGISQGIVVDRVDRFGRSLVLGLLAVQRIQAAGGAGFAVSDGLDCTTDAGRLVLRNMLSNAEWELERRRSAWELARRFAVARGVHCGSRTPIGYRKTRSGRLRPDPRTAPWISELFARRAAGESISRLARWLEDVGLRTSMGNPGWTYSTVKQVLRNRVYLGEVHSQPYVRAGAHPPLTASTTWELAQRPRQPEQPIRSNPTLLAGLARCAGCGHPMIAHHSRDIRRQPNTAYSCTGGHACGRCAAPAHIRGWVLEPLVEAATMQVLARRRSPPDARLRDARSAVADAEGALTAYRDSTRTLAILGPEAFEAGLQVRADRLRRARLDEAMVQARLEMHDLPPANEIAANWEHMTVLARRDIVRRAIDCVFIERGRAPADERITICTVGTGPTDLPSRQDRRSGNAPFRPATSTGRPMRAWDNAILRERLRRFTRGRSTWPSADEFRRRSRDALYRQSVWQGGERFWAAELGLAFRRANQSGAPWTEERVRACLCVVLAGRRTWPSINEFSAAGLRPLLHAIGRTGGSARWAREFSVAFEHYPKGHWTPEAIRATLTQFCADRTRFPTHAEFKAANLGGLLAVLVAQQSVQSWADELGMARARGGRRSTSAAAPVGD